MTTQFGQCVILYDQWKRFMISYHYYYYQRYWSLQARNANPPPVPNFPSLHNTARHVSHINEILEVAEHTVHRMIQEQVAWGAECTTMPRKSRLSWVRNEQELRFFAKEMHSLKTRSQSLSERMQNEIHLVGRIQYHLDCVLILQQAFNLVSQRLGRNAQGDSAIMKTIAIVSLVYLPGTFVSVCLRNIPGQHVIWLNFIGSFWHQLFWPEHFRRNRTGLDCFKPLLALLGYHHSSNACHGYRMGNMARFE